MDRLRVGDLVKRRGVPGDQPGRVIGFADRGGVRMVLVEWADKRIFPNPAPEPEGSLERLERARRR
jgi:hypothetical protein